MPPPAAPARTPAKPGYSPTPPPAASGPPPGQHGCPPPRRRRRPRPGPRRSRGPPPCLRLRLRPGPRRSRGPPSGALMLALHDQIVGQPAALRALPAVGAAVLQRLAGEALAAPAHAERAVDEAFEL